MAITVALLVSGCSQQAPEEVESATVVPVTIEPAALGNITAVVRATGAVTLAPGAELVIVAPEPARIAELPRGEGDRVAPGDLLVRFEIPSATAEVARQRAEIERAQAQIVNTRAAQVRARDLFDRGVAARKEMEDADRDVADAEAALAQGQATLAAAESAVGRAVVRAPFGGVVAKRLHNPGDVVEATASDPILRLVDPRRLEVTAYVPLTELARIVPGTTARIVGGAGARLRVISRPTAVDPGTGSAPMRLAFSTAPPDLAVGSPIQVEFDTEHHAGVLLVPSAAIVREGEETAVLVAAGDKAERRVVVLGLEDGRHTEVQSGLEAGEMVITRGQAGLPDGAAIKVESATP
jgi:RND family efflux transporter MFP subunit